MFFYLQITTTTASYTTKKSNTYAKRETRHSILGNGAHQLVQLLAAPAHRSKHAVARRLAIGLRSITSIIANNNNNNNNNHNNMNNVRFAP
jgi:hypothetical protein